MSDDARISEIDKAKYDALVTRYTTFLTTEEHDLAPTLRYELIRRKLNEHNLELEARKAQNTMVAAERARSSASLGDTSIPKPTQTINDAQPSNDVEQDHSREQGEQNDSHAKQSHQWEEEGESELSSGKEEDEDEDESKSEADQDVVTEIDPSPSPKQKKPPRPPNIGLKQRQMQVIMEVADKFDAMSMEERQEYWQQIPELGSVYDMISSQRSKSYDDQPGEPGWLEILGRSGRTKQILVRYRLLEPAKIRKRDSIAADKRRSQPKRHSRSTELQQQPGAENLQQDSQHCQPGSVQSLPQGVQRLEDLLTAVDLKITERKDGSRRKRPEYSWTHSQVKDPPESTSLLECGTAERASILAKLPQTTIDHRGAAGPRLTEPKAYNLNGADIGHTAEQRRKLSTSTDQSLRSSGGQIDALGMSYSITFEDLGGRHSLRLQVYPETQIYDVFAGWAVHHNVQLFAWA